MFSARSDFRNLSRAGVAENSSRTSTEVPGLSAAGRTACLAPRSTTISCPLSASRRREMMASRAIEPIEGSASPRKPSVAMLKRSSSASLEVACRSTASARSAGPMPSPSSITRISERPPAAATTSMSRAPASSAFSTSSLTTLAGTLDHLARGDAVHGLGAELADGHCDLQAGGSSARSRQFRCDTGRRHPYPVVPGTLVCRSRVVALPWRANARLTPANCDPRTQTRKRPDLRDEKTLSVPRRS